MSLIIAFEDMFFFKGFDLEECTEYYTTLCERVFSAIDDKIGFRK